MHKGVITRRVVNERSAFEFIRGTDGNEYFFLPSGVQRTATAFADLKEQDSVEFTAINHPKGLRAIEIRKIDEAVKVPARHPHTGTQERRNRGRAQMEQRGRSERAHHLRFED